tara:strand:+ start:1934 stop:2287 length:354 start_codon:yes stop_codon:yes gene_type:complete
MTDRFNKLHNDFKKLVISSGEIQHEEATYLGLCETLENSGPDYGHGQIYQLTRIILDKGVPSEERLRSYKLLILTSLGLLQHLVKNDEVAKILNSEEFNYSKQLKLWETEDDKDGKN